jgi:hypothetical protein
VKESWRKKRRLTRINCHHITANAVGGRRRYLTYKFSDAGDGWFESDAENKEVNAISAYFTFHTVTVLHSLNGKASWQVLMQFC